MIEWLVGGSSGVNGPPVGDERSCARRPFMEVVADAHFVDLETYPLARTHEMRGKYG